MRRTRIIGIIGIIIALLVMLYAWSLAARKQAPRGAPPAPVVAATTAPTPTKALVAVAPTLTVAPAAPTPTKPSAPTPTSPAKPPPATPTATPVGLEIRIRIENNRFIPSTIRLKAGDRPRFIITNADNVAHTFTLPGRQFELRLAPRETKGFVHSWAFGVKGLTTTSPFHCEYHQAQGMLGAIITEPEPR